MPLTSVCMSCSTRSSVSSTVSSAPVMRFGCGRIGRGLREAYRRHLPACRTLEQIQFEFDQLQRELEAEIAAGQRDAREKLLDNFDQEVVEKVRIESHDVPTASTSNSGSSPGISSPYMRTSTTTATASPFTQSVPWRKHPSGAIPHGQGRGGCQHLPRRASARAACAGRGKTLSLQPAEVTFQYTDSGKNIAVLESLIGHRGWLICTRLTMSALETEDIRHCWSHRRRDAAGCSTMPTPLRPPGRAGHPL